MKKLLWTMPIWQKIFISTATVLCIAIGVIGVFSYNYAARFAVDEYMSVVEGALNNTSRSFNERFDTIGNIADRIAWSNDVRRILSNEDDAQIADVQKNLKILSSTLIYAAGKTDAVLYVNDALAYSKEHIQFFPISDITKYDAASNLLHSSGNNSAWLTIEREYQNPYHVEKLITVLAAIREHDNPFKRIGLVSVSVPARRLSEMLDDITITEHTRLFIIDEKDNVIVSTGSEEYQPLEKENTIRTHVYQYPLTIAGWKLVALIPESDLREPISAVIIFYIALAAAVLAVTLTASLAIALSMSRRINNLAKLMERQSRSTNIELSPVTSGDEIGALQRMFNKMMTDNKALHNQVYEAELQSQAAELKALQAQINPHFLYNILDTIHWMALEEHAVETAETITELADFFRLSMRTSNSTTNLKEELRHAELYLELQKKRMGDSLDYSIQIPDSFGELQIMKLTIEPLVENAVLHGVRNNKDQSGFIRITARENGKYMEICIEDDGPGFPEGFIFDQLDEKEHFGMRITDKRLRLEFGDEYGLRCDKSKDLGGACVIVRLPLHLSGSVPQ